MRHSKRTGRLLVLAALATLTVAAHAQDAPAPPATARLSGRVVDENDRPIAGAPVSAWAGASGGLRDVAMVNATTGADGRFEMALPFPGVWYEVWARRSGYGGDTVRVIARDGAEVTVPLKAGARHDLTGIVVDGDDGTPAAGARVCLTADGGLREEVRADAAGRFRFEGVADHVGSAVIYAETNKRVTFRQHVLPSDRELSLVLGPPAELAGVVTANGLPLEGATVTLGTDFMSEFALAARSGKDGRFVFERVPPGEYRLTARHESFFQPSEYGGGPQFTLRAGQRSFMPVSMSRPAALEGRVFAADGAPAPGVMVGLARGPYLRPNAPLTRTDEQGRFALRTEVGPHRNISVLAFSPTGGYGTFDAGQFAAGAARAGIAIRLSGAKRLHGTVTDPDGRPIEGVRVGNVGAVTDARGRFDLGWTPIVRGADNRDTTVCLAPRPGGPAPWTQPLMGPETPAPAPPPDAVFCHHGRISIGARPGRESDVTLALERAPLLTFTGKVLDHAGRPAPRADVLLFAGNANADTWRRELNPISFLISSYTPYGQTRDTVLGRTLTDDNGDWTFRVVKEKPDTFQLLYYIGGAKDMSRFSLGAQAPDGASALVRDITFEGDETRRALDVKLEQPPAGTMISGRLLDTDGRPMPGVTVQARIGSRRFTTDADGRFRFPTFGRDALSIRLAHPGWGIVSPAFDGRGADFTWLRDQQGTADVTIVAGREGVVTGTVLRDDGRPVTHFEIKGPVGTGWAYDAGGKFRIEHCPPGRQLFSVRTPDGMFRGVPVEVAPGGVTDVETALPAPDCTLRCRVVEAVDEVRSEFSVYVTGTGFQAGLVPDEEGAFELRVPPGSYSITVSPPDFRSPALAGKTNVLVTEEEPLADVVIELPRRQEVPF